MNEGEPERDIRARLRRLLGPRPPRMEEVPAKRGDRGGAAEGIQGVGFAAGSSADLAAEDIQGAGSSAGLAAGLSAAPIPIESILPGEFCETPYGPVKLGQ